MPRSISLLAAALALFVVPSAVFAGGGKSSSGARAPAPTQVKAPVTTTTVRDHRGNKNGEGGVTVTQGKPRPKQTCVKSVFGGPCVSGQDIVDAHNSLLGNDHGSSPNRDHRTHHKNGQGGVTVSH